MAAPKGNRFWEARSTHGNTPTYKTKEQLWDACCQYFEWTEKNPLKEVKLYRLNEKLARRNLPKMRIMTKSGLCRYIGICTSTWDNYRERDDFLGITQAAEEIMYEQKLSGAAAGFLNANIISRELGLHDKMINEHTGAGGGPIKTQRVERVIVDP